MGSLRSATARAALSLAAALLVAAALAPAVSGYSTSFTNVAPSAGTENLGGIGDPLNPPRYVPANETWAQFVGRVEMWGGVAVDDYDQDGLPDLYLTNDGANVLYHNDGNWSFTEVASAAGIAASGRSMGAAFGDYDNDGCRDLFVASFDGPSTLFKSNCDGTFANNTAAAGISINMKAAGVAWADYDRDAFLDLAVACYTACANVLLRNQGDGTFADVTASARVLDPGYTFQPAWIDYDHDGRLDLWNVNDFGPDRLFRNNGNGTFTDVSKAEGIDREGGGGMGFAAGDIDGDGRLDYFVTNFYNDSLYRDTGSGLDESFVGSPINDFWIGWGANFFDAENDGDADLFVANGFIFEQIHPEFLDDKFFENNGAGQFTNASASLGAAYGGVSHGSAVADFDVDGDLDLFVFNLSGPSMLFRNDGEKGHWLGVDLEGTSSTRDAVGALVTVEFGGRKATRLSMAGDSYLSQSQHALHFGLGQNSLAERVVIEWPSGARQEILNVTSNQTLSVLEPPSLVARGGGDYFVRPGQTFELNASGTWDSADATFPSGANYTWTIGLGASQATLYGEVVTTSMGSSGAFRALLTVRDSLGNADEEPFRIFVEDVTLPIPDAGPDQFVCDNEDVLLSAAGSADNDPAFAILGDFRWGALIGDSLESWQGREVNIGRLPPGAWPLTLRATDPSGNFAQDTAVVYVDDCTAPLLFLDSAAEATEGAPFMLRARGDSGNYSWSFSDGGTARTAYGDRLQYVFLAPGTVQLTLTLRDGANRTTVAHCVVTVRDIAAPNVTLPIRYDAPNGVPFHFEVLSAADGDPTFPSTATFIWTISPPNAPAGGPTFQLFGASPRHTFNAPGTFPVLLEVVDRSGNRAVASSVVVVSDALAPEPQAGKDLEAVEGEMVRFEATATDNDPAFSSSGASRYTWHFEYGGHPVDLEGQNVTFAFERAGIYHVVLTVFDPAGNSASDELTVLVAAKTQDAWPMTHRLLVVAAIVGATLACIPVWLRAARPPKRKP